MGTLAASPPHRSSIILSILSIHVNTYPCQPFPLREDRDESRPPLSIAPRWRGAGDEDQCKQALERRRKAGLALA